MLLVSGGVALAATPPTQGGPTTLVDARTYAAQVGATVQFNQHAGVGILESRTKSWIIYPIAWATLPGENSKTAAVVSGHVEVESSVLTAVLGSGATQTPTAPSKPAAAPTPPPSTFQGVKLINTIKGVLGTPYVWGGESPSGFDCSGLVQWALGRMGVWVPRTSTQQWYYSAPVQQLQPGDLVFFQTYQPGPSHVGVYVGDGQFVSADNNGVKYSSLWVPYWHDRYLGARNPFAHA